MIHKIFRKITNLNDFQILLVTREACDSKKN